MAFKPVHSIEHKSNAFDIIYQQYSRRHDENTRYCVMHDCFFWWVISTTLVTLSTLRRTIYKRVNVHINDEVICFPTQSVSIVVGFIPNRIQQYNTVCMSNTTNSRVIIDVVVCFCWWPPEKPWTYQAGSHCTFGIYQLLQVDWSITIQKIEILARPWNMFHVICTWFWFWCCYTLDFDESDRSVCQHCSR